MLATFQRMAERMAHRATRQAETRWDEALRWEALAEALASVQRELKSVATRVVMR